MSPSRNGEGIAESWAERSVGPVKFRKHGGSAGWNLVSDPRLQLQVANLGGSDCGLRVVLGGSAIARSLFAPDKLDAYAGPISRRDDRGLRREYLSEAKGLRFVQSSHGYEATAPELEIQPGFVRAYDYEWRRSLPVGSARRILDRLEEAHVRVVLWGRLERGDGELTMKLYAGDGDQSAYEETWDFNKVHDPPKQIRRD